MLPNAVLTQKYKDDSFPNRRFKHKLKTIKSEVCIKKKSTLFQLIPVKINYKPQPCRETHE